MSVRRDWGLSISQDGPGNQLINSLLTGYKTRVMRQNSYVVRQRYWNTEWSDLSHHIILMTETSLSRYATFCDISWSEIYTNFWTGLSIELYRLISTWFHWFLPYNTWQPSGGGGGNSNLFYTGVCHFGLKYSTYKSGSTSKKDTHKSGKQEPRKALTTVSSMRKPWKIILKYFFWKVYP